MSAYAPISPAQITAEVDAMHALTAGMDADRAEVVGVLLGTLVDVMSPYDRLLTAAMQEAGL